LTSSNTTTGFFQEGGTIVNHALPGTYTATITKTAKAGYTEVAGGFGADDYNLVTVVKPLIVNEPTPEPGPIPTVVIANTDTIDLSFVNFSGIDSSLITGLNLTATFGYGMGYVGPVYNNFNTNLITIATGTANSTTSTTSSANTTAATPTLPGISGRGSGGDVDRWNQNVNLV
jgi:hypothetical protein